MADSTPAVAAGGKDRKLTPKQRRFVDEYVIDRNGVQAYFRAFGRNTSKGVARSYSAAGEQARRLLGKPEIQAEVKAAEEAYAAKVRISKLRVLKELALIAFMDPADAYEPDPSGGQDAPKPMSKIPAALRRVIQASKTKRRRIVGEGQELYEIEEVEYRFASKQAALESLGKKLGLFKDDGDKDAATLTDAERVALVASLLGVKAGTGEGEK
jgi:phage terminase small subunit